MPDPIHNLITNLTLAPTRRTSGRRGSLALNWRPAQSGRPSRLPTLVGLAALARSTPCSTSLALKSSPPMLYFTAPNQYNLHQAQALAPRSVKCRALCRHKCPVRQQLHIHHPGPGFHVSCSSKCARG